MWFSRFWRVQIWCNLKKHCPTKKTSQIAESPEKNQTNQVRRQTEDNNTFPWYRKQLEEFEVLHNRGINIIDQNIIYKTKKYRSVE